MKLAIGLALSAAVSIATAALCNGVRPQSDTFNGQSYRVTLSSGRQFLIRRPLFYDSLDPKPVYFSFHGGGKNATSQESLSSLSDVYYNPDGIGVYPEGFERTAGSGKRYWLSHPGISQASPNDIDFVLDIINHLKSHYCIDEKRIFATGKSNGGGFVNLLACNSTTAGIFTAFAAVSGAYYQDKLARDCRPGRPVPFLSFHGLNDTTIPYDGKSGHDAGDDGDVDQFTATYPIVTWLSDWVKRNGASAAASNVTLFDGSVQRSTWSSGSTPIIHYKESNLGHVWASIFPNLDCPKPIDVKCPMGYYTFNATTTILNFFAKY